MMINSKTQKYGIVGYPLGHSLSPSIHNCSFETLDVNAVYLPFQIAPDKIDILAKSFVGMGVSGANVTVPYKKEIIKQLDWISDEAKLLNSVNTIHVVDGKLKGYSTDYAGFKRKFTEEGVDFINKSILVIGTGGAASAIIAGLAVVDSHENVTVAGRNEEKCDIIVQKIIENSGKCKKVVLNSDEFVSNFGNYDIVVQTTPIGMSPKVDASVLAENLFNADQIAYDIVYNPLETKFLKDASKNGAKILTGLDMLIYQAAESFKIWTGKEMPVDVVKECLAKV